MKIDDKAYELILPEFPTYDKFVRRGSVNNANIECAPYFFDIKYDKRKKELSALMEDGDYWYDCDIVHYLDHTITETDYKNMVYELQQAYADWVFKTLFKEVE